MRHAVAEPGAVVVKALDAIVTNIAVCCPRSAKYMARACSMRVSDRSDMRTPESVQRGSNRPIGAAARQNFRSCSFPSMEPAVCFQPVDTVRLSASSTIADRPCRPGAQRSWLGPCDAALVKKQERVTVFGCASDSDGQAHLDPKNEGTPRGRLSPSQTGTTRILRRGRQ